MNIVDVVGHERFLSLTRHSSGSFTLRLKNDDGTVAVMCDKDADRLLLAFRKLVQPQEGTTE